jgi:uncharacterized protein YcbK (DUF882 family)
MQKGFLTKLEELRVKWGKPITITSGYRCPTHNAAIGGASRSRHMVGDAVDISITGMTGDEKYRFLKLIIEEGWTGVGLHKQFYHVDTRAGVPMVWFY